VHAKQPYSEQLYRAFWRRAVANQHVTEIQGLFDGVADLPTARVATAGSCFAQHIGKSLKDRGLRYMDYEPAPPFLSALYANRLGYGVYSCRYGNIYTARQLKQLCDEVFGRRCPEDAIWTNESRYFDAPRPGIKPNGFRTYLPRLGFTIDLLRAGGRYIHVVASKNAEPAANISAVVA